MRKDRFTEHQSIAVLKSVEAGRREPSYEADVRRSEP